MNIIGDMMKGINQGPFVNYLQDCEIVVQYTMLGTLEQNGVTDRRSRTVMNMARSIMSTCYY